MEALENQGLRRPESEAMAGTVNAEAPPTAATTAPVSTCATSRGKNSTRIIDRCRRLKPKRDAQGERRALGAA